ncbi:MAG: hypothetical protein AB7G08_26325 [Hyphomicrobiaceae bacterium]
MKSTSRVALVAAAGLFVGGVAMPSAKAADLGGDCCADLEERVAELEATTARKGNRKMSLTVTGQVHRSVIWYDDGHSSTTYYGLDNTNASSRFIFTGNARVTPKVRMGFEIMIEIEAGGTSSKVNQFDEDGKIAATSALGNGVSFNQHNVDAYFGDARRAGWYIEHDDLGRLTVGRWDAAGVLATIDLTGHLFLGASSSFILLNGGFFIRGPQGQYYATTWGNIGDPASASSGRTELVRYDSPVWHGFIFGSFVAEAGDYYGAQIRYANEFQGFRLAGAIGYERVKDIATPVTITPADPAFTGPRPDISVWGIALSAMHVPTGLFVQGHYNTADYGNIAPGAPSGYWGQGAGLKKDTAHWLIQAGISKNWFGYGNTSVYGEYGVATDWGANVGGRDYTTAGFTPVFGVQDTDLRVWGLGIAQNFDAAATAVYLGYRRMEADITCTGAGATCAAAGVTPAKKLDTEAIDVIVMGARVLF